MIGERRWDGRDVHGSVYVAELLSRRCGGNRNAPFGFCYGHFVAAERLQKILAAAGVSSRRKAETLIVEGRVSVDGRVVRELGTRADARKSRIEVDGKRVVLEPHVYIVFHKPRNVVSTMSDPQGRPTVAEYMRRAGARVIPIGRLDFHTSGALLMTNDGDFAGALLHPRKASPKIYVVKVSGVVEDSDLERFRRSIPIDGRSTRPAEVRFLRVEGDKTWLEITLREGRNRQIHRIAEAAGFPVMRLSRQSFAGITCEGLRPGHWHHLTTQELLRLQREYGVPRFIPRTAGASHPTSLTRRGTNERGRDRQPRR